MVLKRASNDLPGTFFFVYTLHIHTPRAVETAWMSSRYAHHHHHHHRCCFVFGPKYHAVLCGKYDFVCVFFFSSHFVMHRSHVCAVKRLLRVDLYNWGVQFCLYNFNVFVCLLTVSAVAFMHSVCCCGLHVI